MTEHTHLSQSETSPKLSGAEAYERARYHDAEARRLRTKATMLRAMAECHDRWSTKWRDWADDDYGDVPYPWVDDDYGHVLYPGES